jgi:hypothetical protein
MSACIDRSPLESRQCGECPPGVACVDGYCVAEADDPGDTGDEATPDLRDADAASDASDLPDGADIPDAVDAGDTGPTDADTGPTCIPTGEEVCDGVDNDCDGVRDNVPGLGSSCIVGEGACRREGVFLCNVEVEAPVCSVEAGLPALEVCNGLDDDCNGVADDLEGVLGAGCDSVEGAVGACVAGVCEYACDGDVLDANGDLGWPDSDGCECTPTGDDVCDGLDNDCDGFIDPMCCDEGRNWSIRFRESVQASDLVIAGVPGVDVVLVAWSAPGAVRYILLGADMRPLGPIVDIDQDASMLRVAASATGFALAWWDGGLDAMLVRTLNLRGEALETALLHEELIGLNPPPRDIDIGFTATDGVMPQLVAVWALDDCEGICLRTAQFGESAHSLGFVTPVQYLRVSGRDGRLLVVLYTDQGEGGQLRSLVIEPGVNHSFSGDDLTSSDSDIVLTGIVPTPEGWVVALADQTAFAPLELFRVGVNGSRQRNRNLGEFTLRASIALVAPANGDELALFHANGLINPRIRYLEIHPNTLSVNQVHDSIASGRVERLAAAPLAQGVLLGAIDDDQNEVRLTLLNTQGARFCP